VSSARTFEQRLEAGPLICAEGYLFELERRGYVQAGPFVPEVSLNDPEALTQLHREFVRAGSDIVEAFTYYGHREKLRLIGKEDLLEPLNRRALELAHAVADEAATAGERPLVAGNISNTNVFDPDDAASVRTTEAMMREQVEWAAEHAVDLIVAETFWYLGEARLAARVIGKVADVPAVVTLAIHRSGRTREGIAPAEACRVLRDEGSAVVGLNCTRGPDTMLPLLGAIVEAVDVPVAALPVPYRTTPASPTFQSLTDASGARAFPTALDPFTCARSEVADFTRAALELGVTYLGLCCGAGPHHVRAMAEVVGRTPPPPRFFPDMSRHYVLGDDPLLRDSERAVASEL
jgi:betaine-homocysteine S-methyltransferase